MQGLSAGGQNIVDVSQASMQHGAGTYQQPGGENFKGEVDPAVFLAKRSRLRVLLLWGVLLMDIAAQFEAFKDIKPSSRGKSKHQITSLVYDLAQKEGELAEKVFRSIVHFAPWVIWGTHVGNVAGCSGGKASRPRSRRGASTAGLEEDCRVGLHRSARIHSPTYYPQ
jgi:hypothetical protein